MSVALERQAPFKVILHGFHLHLQCLLLTVNGDVWHGKGYVDLFRVILISFNIRGRL